MVNRTSRCMEWLKKGLCGLVPIYGGDGRNESMLFFLGEHPVREPRKVQTVVIEITQFFQKDIVLVRQQSRELLGQKTMNPLWISHEVILIPFKMRKPIGREDGAIGYIFNNAVDKIYKEDKGIVVSLKDRQSIPILDSLPTACKRIRLAEELSKYYVERQNNDLVKETAWADMQKSFDQPATRGDIAMLSRNIMFIVDKLTYK